jgi:hypothetical protein
MPEGVRPVSEIEHIATSGRTPFTANHVINMEEKREGDDTMSDKTKDLDEQVLGPFVKSFHKRYEKWKRNDLLLVALQPLPKQVKKEKVIDNLTKLRAEFEEKLSGEG